MNKSSKRVQRTTERVYELTKRLHGKAKSVHGSSECVHGYAECLHGCAKHENECAESENLLSERLHGMTKRVNRMTERVHGLTEHMFKPLPYGSRSRHKSLSRSLLRFRQLVRQAVMDFEPSVSWSSIQRCVTWGILREPIPIGLNRLIVNCVLSRKTASHPTTCSGTSVLVSEIEA